MQMILKAILLSMALVQGLYAQEKGVTVIGNEMWQDYDLSISIQYVERAWQGAMDYCRDLNHANYTDWNLPNKEQLKKLYKNKSRLQSAYELYFWTSSSDQKSARQVYFANGNSYSLKKTDLSFVRCVRAHVEQVDSLYEKEKKVVLIGKTMWDDVSSKQRDWQEAVDYCRDLNHAGYTDWALPDHLQLASLSRTRSRFKNNTADYYWSSYSDDVFHKGEARVVFSDDGGFSWLNRKDMGNVRCVRINK